MLSLWETVGPGAFLSSNCAFFEIWHGVEPLALGRQG